MAGVECSQLGESLLERPAKAPQAGGALLGKFVLQD